MFFEDIHCSQYKQQDPTESFAKYFQGSTSRENATYKIKSIAIYYRFNNT